MLEKMPIPHPMPTGTPMEAGRWILLANAADGDAQPCSPVGCIRDHQPVELDVACKTPRLNLCFSASQDRWMNEASPIPTTCPQSGSPPAGWCREVDNLRMDIHAHKWPQTSPRGMGHYRITEWFGLEGTFQGHLVQPPAMSRDIFNQTRLLRAPCNLAWDGASTTSLGNLCQGFTTLSVKKFFFMSRLNLPSFSLKPSPLVLLLEALLRSLSPSFF